MVDEERMEREAHLLSPTDAEVEKETMADLQDSISHELGRERAGINEVCLSIFEITKTDTPININLVGKEKEILLADDIVGDQSIAHRGLKP